MYLSNLRAERVRAGLSQAELAARSGAGRSAISGYERLRREAYPATVRRLAEVLEVDTAALYGEQPEPPPVFVELREALEAADARGGREEQVAELERYLERDPGRLRTWLYEVTIEELTARGSLSAKDYGGAVIGAGRATAKGLELYPLLLLSMLDLLQDLLERDPGIPAPTSAEESAPVEPAETPETAPEPVRRPAAPGVRRENAAEEEGS